MPRRGVVALFAALALASGACRGQAPAGSAAQSQPADPAVEALVRSFASAIVARDYPSAYGALAAEMRASLPLSEFQETVGHYRDELPDALEAKLTVEPYDKESGSIVPEELRGRIVSEGVVHFEPGGEELEGFSAHVWILMEAGEPKLAHFYVED